MPTHAASMSAIAVAAVALAPATADARDDSRLTAAERAAGWVALFDGSGTGAWRGYRKAGFPERGWVVEGNALRVKAGGGGGDLITKRQFENFELTLEWKAAAGANSGIIYRVTEANAYPWQSGPEMQILDDEASGVASDHVHAAGALYALYPCAAEAKRLEPVGAYNTARIVMRDGVVRHYLNGAKMLEADLNGQDWASRVAASKFSGYDGFGVSSVGHICLQDHGNDVWFRNIRIRDLDAPMPGEIDLLAGDRLDQWTAHLRDGGAMDEVWSLEDGVLRCAGEPVGYIRTNADYTSYVLRLDWRFERAGNSGVLLRMVGEDTVWPKSVEAQLQSGRAGDFWNIGGFGMTVPDERTNGRNTRATHANERELGVWNHYEIVVDGPRVRLIVNDEVVNEATDVEVVAGKICLQSEGAPIEFRNVRLAEIDP